VCLCGEYRYILRSQVEKLPENKIFGNMKKAKAEAVAKAKQANSQEPIQQTEA